MIDNFIFAEPQFVHALWGVLLFCLVLFFLDRRGRSALDRFLSRNMQDRLAARAANSRRVFALALFALSAALMVGALMRPQWGLEYIESPRAGTELMILLDVSKSMLAEDVAPNRLERSKAEVRDLLSFLEGDHIGLIAFAGEAKVLAPLTPDFGFFRLVLAEASPESVGRGGTNIAAAIDQGLNGFEETGDLSRAMLLITDGEDHDEYALEAAKRALERGIKIFTIGFGDENAGTEITITDAKTGARTTLRDLDDNIVRSKLNGELLRKIATTTQARYIPAGTGSLLDLQAIYDQHIAPLTRGQLDGRGREVRKDAFQYLLLAALLILAASIGLSSRGAKLATLRGIALLLCFCNFFPLTVYAQDSENEPQQESTEEKPAEVEEPSEEEDIDAREKHNEALQLFHSQDYKQAFELFEQARNHAEDDSEARFAATYHLGLTKAHSALLLIEAEPEQALAAFIEAAEWFRSSIRQREQHLESRQNLEWVLRKARALQDQLEKKEPKDYPKRIDELIKRQRQSMKDLQVLSQASKAAEQEGRLEGLRSSFRIAAREFRVAGSDVAVLVRDASHDLRIIDDKAEDKRQPEDQMRKLQLEAMNALLHNAGQRLGQARRHLRKLQALDAHRRTAAALQQLKRARDQFRQPDDLLRVLIADGRSLGNWTMLGAQAKNLSLNPGDNVPGGPQWITDKLLQETQASITERTQELSARMTAAAQQELPAADPNTQDPQAQQQQQQQQDLIERMREAGPFVEKAVEHWQASGSHLDQAALLPAAQQQQLAINALSDALERFADLRGLIEIAHREQSLLDSWVAEDQVQITPQAPSIKLADFAQQLGAVQQRNIARVPRIRELLDKEQQKVEAEAASANSAPTANPPAGQDPEPEPENQQLERIKLAQRILMMAEYSMKNVVQALGIALPKEESSADVQTSEPPPSFDAIATREASKFTLQQITELRRLFFTLIDHLKDTAQRQNELADSTDEIQALPAQEQAIAAGPLPSRQQELAKISKQIADALIELSQTPPAVAPGGQDPQAQQKAQQEAENYARAAELVTSATGEMQSAAQLLNTEALDLAAATTHERTAVEQLLAAIAILEPPQENKDSDQQQQQQEDQQQQQPQPGQASDLLQDIAEREAERRKSKPRQNGSITVEKDW